MNYQLQKNAFLGKNGILIAYRSNEKLCSGPNTLAGHFVWLGFKFICVGICILGVFVLCSGCASTKRGNKQGSRMPPIAVYPECRKEDYYKNPDEWIRFHEQLKAYPVGRYVDPNNPNMLHEAHTLYRLEKPCHWNRNTNKPTVVPLGPTYAIADPNHMKSPISEQLESALIAQTEIMQTLHAQNQDLLTKVEVLEDEIMALKATQRQDDSVSFQDEVRSTTD